MKQIRVALLATILMATLVLLAIVMKLSMRVDGLEERLASQETTRIRY